MSVNDWIREPLRTGDPIGNAFYRMNKAIIVYFGPVVLGLLFWVIVK